MLCYLWKIRLYLFKIIYMLTLCLHNRSKLSCMVLSSNEVCLFTSFRDRKVNNYFVCHNCTSNWCQFSKGTVYVNRKMSKICQFTSVIYMSTEIRLIDVIFTSFWDGKDSLFNQYHFQVNKTASNRRQFYSVI